VARRGLIRRAYFAQSGVPIVPAMTQPPPYKARLCRRWLASTASILAVLNSSDWSMSEL
jgi:hypothetical protein